MQYITGRIVIVGDNEVVTKKGKSFSSVFLVIKKRTRNKVRNMAYKCYGRLAEKAKTFNINDKVEIEYFSESIKSKNPRFINEWFTKNNVVGLEKIVVGQKTNRQQRSFQFQDATDKAKEYVDNFNKK